MSSNKSFSSETSDRYSKALFELAQENNELKNWTSIVREAYENENLLLTIGKNSKNLVNDIYHLDIFNTKLESFLEFEDILGSLDD